ncbi:MAG TPA: hypothetical protein VJN18_26870 [Polyangiaceae bacterium]|nr:hypothetical protein [Polyangiaceae bacterium]
MAMGGQGGGKPSGAGASTLGGAASTRPDGEAGAPLAMGDWLQGTAGDGTAGDGNAGAAGAAPVGGGGQGGAGGADGDDTWSSAGASGEDDCALEEATFIPIADRRDVVIDEIRCRLYVSTTGGVVYSYDLKSHELEPFVSFDTTLEGIDLSPARGTLVVADGDASPYADDKGRQSLPGPRSLTWALIACS